MLRAAKADADDDGMERLTLLALGTAVCASDLTVVLADHKNITTQQLLDEVVAARRDKGADETPMPDLLLAMRADDPGQAADLLGNLIAGDHGAFLDLIVELGDYAATCVSLLAVLEISPVEDTLAELEKTVQQFFAGKQPPGPPRVWGAGGEAGRDGGFPAVARARPVTVLLSGAWLLRPLRDPAEAEDEEDSED